MGDPKRHWSDLDAEKKLGIVVVPIVVAAISVLPLLIGGGDREAVVSAPQSADSAASAVEYRKDVGDVCEDLSAALQRRRRNALGLRGRLTKARTTRGQRDATINDTQGTIDLSTPIYAAFSELTPPVEHRTRHRRAVRAWNDSLARLRAYRASLEAGVTHERLVLGLDKFKRGDGPIIEREGVEVRARLEALGGADCDIAPVETVRVFSLPRIEATAPRQGATATATSAPTEMATAEPIVPTPPTVPTPGPTKGPQTPPEGRPVVPTPVVPTPAPTITPTVEAESRPIVPTPGLPRRPTPTPRQERSLVPTATPTSPAERG